MASHRFGRDRPGNVSRATTGDVFAAISRDEWAKDRLGEVYRKLFEGEGVRQGASPDHFIYVTPGKARAEINELATWVGERFGEPAGTVPAKTPFGYLSGRYDGWITLFAALAHGGDRSLAEDFVESVSGMSWAAYGSSRFAGSGAPPAAPFVPASESPQSSQESTPASASTPTPPPTAPSPSPSPPPMLSLTSPRTRGRSAPPSTGSVVITPAPVAEKPGILERVFGVKPASPAPPPSLSPSPPLSEQRQWTEEDEEEARRTFEALRAGGRGKTSAEALRDHRKRMEAELESLRLEVEGLRNMGFGEAPVGKPREVFEESELAGAKVKAEIAEQVRIQEMRQRAEEEKSTVEKLRRPEGTKVF